MPKGGKLDVAKCLLRECHPIIMSQWMKKSSEFWFVSVRASRHGNLASQNHGQPTDYVPFCVWSRRQLVIVVC